MSPIAIHEIQGSGLYSPHAGERVRVRGIVTGIMRRAFFVQDPAGQGRPGRSDAICVFHPRARVQVGAWVDVEGEVVDYAAGEGERPTTQLSAEKVQVLHDRGKKVEPVWLDAAMLEVSPEDLARRLNSLEGMLVGIAAGSTMLAPSNPFGDYVALPAESQLPRTRHGGVRIDSEAPLRWFPGFRITDYAHAPRVDVGAKLLDPVIGPLHYRASSFQILALHAPQVSQVDIDADTLPWAADDTHLTVLTLNGFNLDPKVERPDLVADPRRDIDDDVGDGRYAMLARVIAVEAQRPDVVALQEIQDDDGAEITANVGARKNYQTLIHAIRRAGGPPYRWAEVPPQVDADGGQPGGNIRNAFLYRPDRVELVAGSLRRLGVDEEAFVDSRKPLVGRFRFISTGRRIELLNLHLASKRHQHPIFAPSDPGLDPREEMRVAQAAIVADELDRIEATGMDTYTTGDFNDYEFSATVHRVCGRNRVNLVEHVPVGDRYDYNHRGVLQALMHGIVSRGLWEARGAEYAILHGNELTGVQPGEMGSRATDHAYVLARLRMGE
jgi:hypothetical protein